MKTTFEHIPGIIRKNGFEYFTVSTSKTGNSFVFKSDDDKDMEANIDELVSLMNVVTGDYFVLTGQKNKQSNNSQFKFEYSNYKGAQPQVVTGIGNASVGYTEDFVQKMIQTEIGKVKYELAEKDLERREKAFLDEKREFDNRKNDAIEIGLQRLGEYFPKMFGKGTTRSLPATQHYSQVAGVETPTEIQVLEGDELSDKVSELLEKWESADPDWLLLLTKIVDFSSSGKVIDLGMAKLDYDTVKQMIIEKL